MLIDALSSHLLRSEALEAFWSKLDAGQDASVGVASSARAMLVAARFAAHPQSTLVVVPGEDAAQEFARLLTSYLGDARVMRFPERADLPFAHKASQPFQIASRLCALDALASSRELVVVASARSLLRKLPPRQSGVAAPLILRGGVELAECEGAPKTFEELPAYLDMLGFTNTGDLEGPGAYALHGGTLDIYPGNLSYPVRVEFFGDLVDEIRRIVPATGQSIATLDEVAIYAVSEQVLDDSTRIKALRKLANRAETNKVLRKLYDSLEGRTTPELPDLVLPYAYDKLEQLGDYLADDALVSLIEPRAIFDDALHAAEELAAAAKGSGVSHADYFFEPATIRFGTCAHASYGSLTRVGEGFDAELRVKRTNVAGDPEKLFSRLREFCDQRFAVVFSVPGYRAREDLKLELVDRGLPICDWGEDADEGALKRGIVNVTGHDIALGMVLPDAQLALVSINDTQGSGTVRTRKHVDITQISFPYNPGDYVVHASHGIAFFRELVNQDVDGVRRDYLLLEYAEGDRLFVPVEQLDRISRYVGPEGASPKLTRLNTADWSHALKRATAATKKLAFDLVDIYTRRAASKGFAFSPDTPWQRQLEESFPYQETPDQLAAISDIKSDMESERPMDRLVCGDVGFGKTEVALRAAFKATQDAKQVMVLCPTTILAQQHYTTFHERFEPFGVKVEVISRFRTPAQQKRILEDFSRGDIEVLVGTHRLLSADVNPSDLGLLIVDEEQRFGVGAKEQMKDLRQSIDVLTLSATPIPRTMQMSLSGVRDLSLILTPPDDRRPVQVRVGEWDPDVVSDAIRYELARKGQVYYVSNRVNTIDEAVERVHAAAGEARVGVAHGKMSKTELEQVMEDFSAGALDVLVATTIIESGIDNPHTNTLIIEDSQRLGLAQLYQLKGRVGRSSTQAFAYFMFPDNAHLTEEALERLEAIDEHRELGSGMRIAMKDLEIRGAGSMIGAEQHGNMSVVGFDLFAQMLSEAITATREGRAANADLIPQAMSDITVNIPVHTYLPDEYIRDGEQRVLLYRRLASCDDPEVLDALFAETKERYGDPPEAAINFFAKARIRAQAYLKDMSLVAYVGGSLVLEPVALSRTQLVALKRKGARYNEASKRLTLPPRAFGKRAGESLELAEISAFIESLEG